MLEPPKHIGRYAIERRLTQQGGMGTLFLGRDPTLGRGVVIKMVRADSRPGRLV